MIREKTVSLRSSNFVDKYLSTFLPGRRNFLFYSSVTSTSLPQHKSLYRSLLPNDFVDIVPFILTPRLYAASTHPFNDTLSTRFEHAKNRKQPHGPIAMEKWERAKGWMMACLGRIV